MDVNCEVGPLFMLADYLFWHFIIPMQWTKRINSWINEIVWIWCQWEWIQSVGERAFMLLYCLFRSELGTKLIQSLDHIHSNGDFMFYLSLLQRKHKNEKKNKIKSFDVRKFSTWKQWIGIFRTNWDVQRSKFQQFGSNVQKGRERKKTWIPT